VPMRWERVICRPLAAPMLLGGLPAVVAAAWIVGFPAAAFVAAGCATCAAATAWMISQSAQQAGARLRRRDRRGAAVSPAPDSGSPALWNSDLYRPLLDEALGMLVPLESELDKAVRARTELEARTHVKRQRIQQLEAALGCVDDPLLVTDESDRILFYNRAAARLCGLEANKPTGPGKLPEPAAGSEAGPGGRPESGTTDLSALTAHQLPPALLRLLQETRTRDAAADCRRTELEFGSGESAVRYRATATRVWDAEDRPLGVVTVLKDIGDETREKTRHAEFVSAVCHELKTPMSSIRAFAEMLLDGDVTDPDEQRELYGFIDVQVDRLTRLVNNMLNLARIESGVIKVQREDLELGDVLNRSLDVVRQLAEEKQIRLVPELSPLYTAVHVDSDLFGQAVINLLSNAIKYTPEGGEVRLRSRMDEDRAVIEVRDTGMGIPADSLPRIFDRFYRVPENNQAAAGTGLGLSLVHYIVTELHNGSIAVASEVDRGSCFTVSVPLGHRGPGRKKHEPALAAG
jgi:two-component system, OmpR family, phosphate regulon sensor histidine kinase PhoR